MPSGLFAKCLLNGTDMFRVWKFYILFVSFKLAECRTLQAKMIPQMKTRIPQATKVMATRTSQQPMAAQGFQNRTIQMDSTQTQPIASHVPRAFCPGERKGVCKKWTESQQRKVMWRLEMLILFWGELWKSMNLSKRTFGESYMWRCTACFSHTSKTNIYWACHVYLIEQKWIEK